MRNVKELLLIAVFFTAAVLSRDYWFKWVFIILLFLIIISALVYSVKWTITAIKDEQETRS